MQTFISILRGINVNGQKLIKMDALQKSYENLGFLNVRTYVQSGNVIFFSKEVDTQKLELLITQQIEKDFGYKVPVIVLSIDTLKQVIENNPFLKDQGKDPSFFHVTFLNSEPGKFNSKSIEDKKQDGEEIIFSGNVVYLYCPNGYGKTKLTNNFEAKLKVGATTRNWKTTNEIFKIAEQLS